MGDIKIVSASAGSGKTYRLSYEYVRNVIGKPSLYRNILAVTFTNKATEEMKQRILSEIHALAGSGRAVYMDALQRDLGLAPETIRSRAAEVRTKILHDYSHFTILTIDKFFQRIIRAFLRELGIDTHFNLELQTDGILAQATDRLIDEIPADEKLRRWLVRFVEEKIEESKRWDIREELTALGREIFREQYRTMETNPPDREELASIVGEAMAKRNAVKERVMKIAREALGAIADAGLTIDDFPYGRNSFVSYLHKCSEGVFERPGKRVTDALADEAKWYAKNSPRREEIRRIIPRVMPLLTELCSIYDENIRFLNTTELLRENFRSFALLADLAEKIDTLCAEQNLLPISETNSILQKLIGGNDTPFIFEKVGTYFSHYMIDEFQDTSRQQWGNFLPLLQNAVAQTDNTSVLLVGDVKQSIYRWRGGDWQILGRQVQELFREVQVQQLDTNYRSLGMVVGFNNRMIDSIVRQDDEQIDALLDEAYASRNLSAECRAELQGMAVAAYEGHSQKSVRGGEQGYVRIVQHEESPLIPIIEELQERGYAPSDIAILVRYNADARRIARELLDHKAAHPDSPYCYDVVTQEALTIGNSPAAGFIMAAFALASSPEDTLKRALYNQFLDRKFAEPLPDSEVAFLRNLRQLSLEEALEEILFRYGLHNRPEHTAYIQALQEQLLSFATSRISDIPLFLKWWEETGSAQSVSLPRNGNAITVISIHKSKGLQFKAVILPCCNWGLAPRTNSILWSRTSETPFRDLNHVPVRYKKAMENSFFAEDYCHETVLSHIDNINTFYVAATRAEEELYLLIPRSKPSIRTRISDLILNAVRPVAPDDTTREDLCQKILLGDLPGRSRNDASSQVYEFGQPLRFQRQAVAPETPAGYPVRRIGTRLKFHLDSQRYFEESDPSATAPLSPRSHGMIMHRVFESLTDHTQIAEQLQRMRASGLISEEESERVESVIDKALANPIIRSWFDPEWEVVRNEHDIVVPGGGTGRRPDRVVARGMRAIVVDYKFGQRQNPRHASQVGEYMKLLWEMGYRDIRGFIWYVEQERVEEVPANV